MTPIYDEMLKRLTEARTQFYRERILYGLVLSGFAGSVGTVVVSVTEALFNGSVAFRTLLVVAASVAFFSITAALVVVPVLRWMRVLGSLSENDIALRVGETFPEIRDRLRNILEIFEEHTTGKNNISGFHPEYSPELIDASFADLQRNSTGLQFAEIVC